MQTLTRIAPTPALLAQKIDLYLDSADRASVIENNGHPLVAGMTTNPSLMRKSGVTDYRAFAQEVLRAVTRKPISFEVFSDTLEEMEREAREIRTWGPNVYVKVPIQTTNGTSTIPLIERLHAEGTHLNVTALFTDSQVSQTIAAVSGAAKQGTPQTLASVFAGRLADTGLDPMPLMRRAAEQCRQAGPAVRLLWASTREVYNVVQAVEAGCHIITIPPDVWKKLNDQWGRSPEELSLDTVRAFRKDSLAAGFRLE